MRPPVYVIFGTTLLNSVAVALWFLKAWAKLPAFELLQLYLFLKYAFSESKLTENIVDHSPPHGSGRPG